MPFVKRKKRPEISSPTNFEHRVHSGFDHDNGVFVGLPSQWNSIINEASEHQKSSHLNQNNANSDSSNGKFNGHINQHANGNNFTSNQSK